MLLSNIGFFWRQAWRQAGFRRVSLCAADVCPPVTVRWRRLLCEWQQSRRSHVRFDRLSARIHAGFVCRLCPAQSFTLVLRVVFLIGLIGLQAGHAGLIDGLKTLLRSSQSADAEEEELADAPVADATPSLTPKMRGALDYVSKRYRVLTEALEPIFETAQLAGKDLRIDPLLIIAVIGCSNRASTRFCRVWSGPRV